MRRDPIAFLVRSILLRLTDVIELWRDSVWLHTHIASGTRLPGTQAAPAFHPYRDLSMALISGAVTAAAVIGAVVFWILSAWPTGPTAVTFTGIICAIMGGRDDPVAGSTDFLRMSLFVTLVAACYLLVILPPLTGFVPLVAALAPFYLICGLFLAMPSTSPLVMPVIFIGGGLMAITNRMVYDFETFINLAIGDLFGIGMAVVALHLLRPRGVVWAVRRLVLGLLRDLATICHAAKVDRAAFESRMFDRINALFARLDPMMPEDRAIIQGGLASLRVGLNIIALRTLLPDLPAMAAEPVQETLEELADHFTEIAGGGDKPVPLALLERVNRQILALDEDASTVRTAEAIFSIGMTMRQHSQFFGEPSSADTIDGLAAVTA